MAKAKPKAKKSPKHKKVGSKKKKPAKQQRKTTPAKPTPSKATQKRKPPPPPAAPEQAMDALDSIRNALGDILDDSGDTFAPEPMQQVVGGRDAIHVELGAKLTATRGDLQQERDAIATAIESFMRLAIANGLAPDASAYTAHCPEFFWEGDGANPPVYARVPDATHDEIGRWFQLIVEGVRAYDTRIGANPN
ncbi:MAG TPA: hypothetical protein VIV11_27730 [Kofleriaceae bacterium]